MFLLRVLFASIVTLKLKLGKLYKKLSKLIYLPLPDDSELKVREHHIEETTGYHKNENSAYQLFPLPVLDNAFQITFNSVKSIVGIHATL